VSSSKQIKFPVNVLLDATSAAKEFARNYGGGIHPSSPGSTLPSTSNFVGEQFLRTGEERPGLWFSLDLVGNWRKA